MYLGNIMVKIDNLDRKILNVIISNARTPFKEIADSCGVSRAAVHQRVQRLIEAKVITGSGYHIDYKMVGYTTFTYVGVKLEKGSLFREVTEELKKIDEVVECHFTTGAYSMLIKLISRDNAHLMEILSERIQFIPGVLATETMISLEENFTHPYMLPEVTESK